MSPLSSKRVCLSFAALLLFSLSGCARPCVSWKPIAWHTQSRNRIPDRYPLGSINRAHYQQMQTNAEATDFVINLNEFAGETSELTPDAKDHVMEIAARMRSAPFPVIVERSINNTNPQLDAERRNAVAKYLTDLGNPDAEQRTFVATPYDRGLNSFESQFDYFQFLFAGRGFGNGLGFGGFGGGGLGGFGGGGFGSGFGGSSVGGIGFGP
jgi:hypothetical protein